MRRECYKCWRVITFCVALVYSTRCTYTLTQCTNTITKCTHVVHTPQLHRVWPGCVQIPGLQMSVNEARSFHTLPVGSSSMGQRNVKEKII